MRILLVIVVGVGTALLVGGLLAFVFGGWILRTPLTVVGLGRFDGVWAPADYCFLGAVMASFGAGLVSAGRLMLGQIYWGYSYANKQG